MAAACRLWQLAWKATTRAAAHTAAHRAFVQDCAAGTPLRCSRGRPGDGNRFRHPLSSRMGLPGVSKCPHGVVSTPKRPTVAPKGRPMRLQLTCQTALHLWPFWSPASPPDSRRETTTRPQQPRSCCSLGFEHMEPPQVLVGPKRVDPLRSGLLFGQGAPSPAGQAQAPLQEPASGGGGGAFRSPAPRCGGRLLPPTPAAWCDPCSY